MQKKGCNENLIAKSQVLLRQTKHLHVGECNKDCR